MKNHIKILKRAGNASKAAYDKEAEIIKKKIAEAEKEAEEMSKRAGEKEQVIYILPRTNFFKGSQNFLH